MSGKMRDLVNRFAVTKAAYSGAVATTVTECVYTGDTAGIERVELPCGLQVVRDLAEAVGAIGVDLTVERHAAHHEERHLSPKPGPWVITVFKGPGFRAAACPEEHKASGLLTPDEALKASKGRVPG